MVSSVLMQADKPVHNRADSFTTGKAFVELLKTCARNKDLHRGTRVHADILRKRLLEKNPFVASGLVNMYSKCGALAQAHDVFEGLPTRDLVSWSALVAGYAQIGYGKKALNCFEQMQHEGLSANAVTFACVLKACGAIRALIRGEMIHREIVRRELLIEDILGAALVEMYAKCGAPEKAREILESIPVRSVLAWSALIAGYAQIGCANEALNCLDQMQKEGLYPTAVIFVCALRACGSMGLLEKGEQIHACIIGQGLVYENVLLGNSLVDMYVKCGALAKASFVFEDIPDRNEVGWSSLIAGYAQEGYGEEALDCFERMQNEGFSSDIITFACVLKACGSISAFDKGEKIHFEIERQGLLGKHIVLGNALVDMYVKCGLLAKGKQVVEGLPNSDEVSWSSLITGYAQEGNGKEALNCFAQMQQKGLYPDAATFVGILKACTSLGSLDYGIKIHSAIVKQGLLDGHVVLCGALVDMYAKCGALTRAKEVLEEFSTRNVILWNTLLTGYAQESDGKEALNCLEQMQCEGLSPDGITFLCVLTACSHSGLVIGGQMCFQKMSKECGLSAALEHYTCMVVLSGRAGLLDKAVAIIKKASFIDYPPLWSSLLFACQTLQNAGLGRWVFKHCLLIDTQVGVL